MDLSVLIWLFLFVILLLALASAIIPMVVKPPESDEHIYLVKLHGVQKLFVLVLNLTILWVFLIFFLSGQYHFAVFNLIIGLLFAIVYASPFDMIQKVWLNTFQKKLYIRDWKGENSYDIKSVNYAQMGMPGKIRLTLPDRKLTIPSGSPGVKLFEEKLKALKELEQQKIMKEEAGV